MPVPPSPTAPPVGGERLVALVEAVDLALDGLDDDRPVLLRVRAAPAADPDGRRPGGVALGIRRIDPEIHPLDALVGFRAPAAWSAIGLAASGVATPPGGGRPFPVRTVQLVDRAGAWAGRLRGVGPAPAPEGLLGASSSTAGDPAPTGRVDDALRRAVGAATGPPPPGGTLLLWAVWWLDDLVAAAAAGDPAAGPRVRSVTAALGRHPAVTILGLDPADVDVERLVAEGRRLAAWRGWTDLRRSCADGTWRTADLDAATAAWLDDGSFARWLLGTRPDLDDLHGALGALLPPAARRAVEEVLAAWCLLPGHGPPVPDPTGRGQ